MRRFSKVVQCFVIVTGVALLGSVVWCLSLPRLPVPAGSRPGIPVAGKVRVSLLAAWRGPAPSTWLLRMMYCTPISAAGYRLRAVAVVE